MVALQGGTGGQVSWVHQDPVTKSQRVTNAAGTILSTIDLDPFGGETARSAGSAFQPRKYTPYERDSNGSDEAMHRRFDATASRFSQPDPYDGSYSMTNPQSFNRYAYVGNDPVNFTDPTGLYEICTTGSDGTITCRDVGGRPGTQLDGGPIFYTGERETVYDNPLFDLILRSPDRSWKLMPTAVISNRTSNPRNSGLSPGEIQKRIAEGQVWDNWHRWLHCNGPIMNKYNGQLNDFHKLGGTAFWWEVGAGIGAATAIFGAGSSRVGGVIGTGTETGLEDGLPVGVWGVFLAVIGTHYAERQHINDIMSEYQKEVGGTCGPKPPHP
ncbi:MAG: RHS repeat-associated core domain-containing protein [Acidobacteriota bacterium]